MSTLDSTQLIEPMEPTNTSARAIGVRYGGIASLILILIGLGAYVSGMNDYSNQNSATSWIMNLLTWGVMAGALILAMKNYRDQTGGYMTFGKGFTVGLWASLVMAVVTAVWTYIFFTLIAPDLMDTILEATREKMLEGGQSEEQVDQAMEYTKAFMSPVSFTFFAGLFTFITGLLISLIAAAVTQRKPPMNTTY